MKGREHEKKTAVFLLLTAPAAGLLFSEPAQGVAGYMAGGVLGALWLSPDLDLEDSRPSRRWGLLRVLWAPYRAFHPHRGASHSYLYGPLSRLLYLLLLVLLLGGLGGVAPKESLSFFGQAFSKSPDFFASALLGYLVSQWAHSFQDGVPLRRASRRRTPR